jgi:hypothetical protein
MFAKCFSIRDFQEINYPKKRTTEAQSTQRENFCISFGTFFYLEVSYKNNFYLASKNSGEQGGYSLSAVGVYLLRLGIAIKLVLVVNFSRTYR